MRTIEIQLLTYLLNSLWQVPLVFAAAWIAARVVRRDGPATEHRIWVSALILEAVLPACSVTPSQILHRLAQLIPWSWTSRAIGGDVRISTASGAAFAHSLLHLPPQLLTTIALAYAGIVMYGAARLLRRLWTTKAMRRRSQPVVLSTAAAHIWTRCSNQFDVRDAQVAVSREASYPMTMGLLRRLVLLPSEFAELLEEDLASAIAHEFAHMQRRDFAKNLVYEILSLPIAYHPLLWLTRTRLEETREMVCDAMAANAVAGPQKYARSLLRLASHLAHGTPDRTRHAIGILDANIFERRIMNLTHTALKLRRAQRLATATACIAIGLGTCASALALRINVASPSSFQSDSPPSTEVGNTPRVPASVMAGNRLNFVQPVYPPEAKEAKISGIVILKARIGKDGAIENLQVVSGPKEFLKSSLDAVKQWNYRPYLLNGQPTEVDTTITVTYSLAN